ncbi:MAG: glycosyltransferase [Deltaproteobacteria bacterium]|nr:glycosyltransferase [Deltaproteobacteria bacterium]
MKISIVTPTLNASKTIKKCIKSINSQDYPHTEHVIIDGNSKDGTLEIINRYPSNNRIVLSESDHGIYDAMNRGILMASGEIIGILNADDFYPDNNIISRVVNAFEENETDSCYGDLIYVDPINTTQFIRYWKSSPYNDKLFYKGWMPPHPTFFVKKRAYENYGLYRLDLGTAADYELMLRFLLKFSISTHYIPHVLVKMRTGGKSNLSIKNRIMANINDRKAWKINGLKPKPWTLFLKPLSKMSQFF